MQGQRKGHVGWQGSESQDLLEGFMAPTKEHGLGDCILSAVGCCPGRGVGGTRGLPPPLGTVAGLWSGATSTGLSKALVF